jgi:ParB/RepB/Spo0J family partition protein
VPRKKIEGVSQGDAGKYCLLSHLELAPNARDHLDPERYEELKAQIKAHGGVHTPLKCSIKPGDTGLVVWDGQRRYRAACELELERVPVIIMRGNECDHILAAGTGEGESHDLVSQIRWVQMAVNAGADQKRIAETRGVSPAWVSQRVKLSALSETARDALREGVFTMTLALKLASKPEAEQNEKIESIREAKKNGAKRPGSLPPKRPSLKKCRNVAEKFESASGVSQTQIEAFQDGVSWAAGEMSTEAMADKYGLEM